MKPSLSLMVIAILTLCACTPLSDNTNDSDTDVTSPAIIKIGSASPLSGPSASLGQDAANGVKLAIMEANEEKLILDGRPVVFEALVMDDHADPKQATLVAEHLVSAKVAGVIGHLNSGASIPAALLYAQAGIPMISAASTSTALTSQGYRNIFRLVANDAQQSLALAQYAVNDIQMKRAIIVDDRTAYGSGLAGEFSRSFITLGGEIIKHEYASDATTDFSSVINSIKSNEPDLVFYAGMFTQAALLLKQMRAQGITTPFMGGDGIYTREFITLAGKDAEGAYASKPGIIVTELPSYQTFNNKYRHLFKSNVQLYAPYTYDATKTMIEAMKRAGSAEPSKYLPQLSRIEHYGITGPIRFDRKGDIKDGTTSIYHVSNGKWQST